MALSESVLSEGLVRVYRGGHLIEQRFCEIAERAADVVESWAARPAPAGGELMVVEPHPPEVIVGLLRTIADAVEQERVRRCRTRSPIFGCSY